MKTKASPLFRDAALCIFAALLSLFLGLAIRRHQSSPPPSPTEATSIGNVPLSLAEFRAAVDDRTALVIDARDDIFYARGHVPRSLSLPNRRFDARYSQLRSLLEADRAHLILVYCNNTYCGDSSEVQTRLHALGFTNVVVFPDGWDAWKTAGYPEEKSDAAMTLHPWKNPS
jgi:rhodanese-related sulfurtransferase